MGGAGLEIALFLAVEGDEDEDHHGEGPEGAAAVGEEGEGDADDGHEADGHADVDEEVHEEAAGEAVAVDAGEGLAAVFGILDDAGDHEHIQGDDDEAAEEAPFFADGAEDEVGALLGTKP